ncbi:Ubiquitin carboxyl-terminal hydrolase 24 [Cichlidogyrus casuarinus]|uniref:Ubiquitin carboxyl-terminal hydrolase 24 n=1 Tax=Cichlidogyrus casuarinus TaxID=1844966 RepID=A0ABD2QJ22_9PLAT
MHWCRKKETRCTISKLHNVSESEAHVLSHHAPPGFPIHDHSHSTSHGQSGSGIDKLADGCPIPSGRWFKFNDTTVEEVEFDDATLEQECFGGEFVAPADLDKDKPDKRIRQWNGYLLFYEKVSLGSCLVNDLDADKSLSELASSSPNLKRSRLHSELNPLSEQETSSLKKSGVEKSLADLLKMVNKNRSSRPFSINLSSSGMIPLDSGRPRSITSTGGSFNFGSQSQLSINDSNSNKPLVLRSPLKRSDDLSFGDHRASGNWLGMGRASFRRQDRYSTAYSLTTQAVDCPMPPKIACQISVENWAHIRDKSIFSPTYFDLIHALVEIPLCDANVAKANPGLILLATQLLSHALFNTFLALSDREKLHCVSVDLSVRLQDSRPAAMLLPNVIQAVLLSSQV